LTALLALIFHPARRSECGVVAPHKRATTPLGKNERQPFGLRLKKRHTTLFVVYLEPPNFSPHALYPKGTSCGASGAFSGATEPSK